jgi:GMP synthase (glutamine-hydrolysing)
VVEVEAASIRRAFAPFGATLTMHDATLARPPAPTGFDGVVVGGSFGSANDQEPWRLALRDWLTTHPNVPLLGICGGHQLLAHALGAPVEVSPASQMGVYPLVLSDVPGFTGRVVQLHHERVATVPPGAELWATDEMGIQALRYGPRRWTVQFHPEMDAEVVQVAGAQSGLSEDVWADLDAAVAGGRAVLSAWIRALTTPV